MALKETFKHLKDLLAHITHDLDKAEGGNKAASQRVRTGTVKLEKVAKVYRKESIKSEKLTKGTKKPAKKAAHKAAPKKAAAHHAKAHKPAKAAVKVKAKPKAHKASHKAAAHHHHGRALSFRRAGK